jgi:hypothetical protein
MAGFSIRFLLYFRRTRRGRHGQKGRRNNFASKMILQMISCKIRGSIVVSISACHAEDPGSIPGRGDFISVDSGRPRWPGRPAPTEWGTVRAGVCRGTGASQWVGRGTRASRWVAGRRVGWRGAWFCSRRGVWLGGQLAGAGASRAHAASAGRCPPPASALGARPPRGGREARTKKHKM